MRQEQHADDWITSRLGSEYLPLGADLACAQREISACREDDVAAGHHRRRHCRSPACDLLRQRAAVAAQQAVALFGERKFSLPLSCRLERGPKRQGLTAAYGLTLTPP